MFVKLTVLACLVAAALADGKWYGPLAGGAPADLYPAGVSPQACPNYPHCSNPAVAVQGGGGHGGYAGGYGGGAGAGGWNGGAGAGAWNGGHAAGGWNGGNDGGHWNGGNNGQWNGGNNGQWNGDNGGGHNGGGGDWGQNALDRGDYTGDGDYRGEGLAESGAYGGHDGGAYGGGYDGSQGYAAAPAYAHGAAAQVPAGVDPHSCPNYPFCH